MPPLTVGTYGKDVTNAQLERLRTFEGEIVFAFDGDAWLDAQLAALRLGLVRDGVYWVKLPPGEDPGNLGADVVTSLRRRRR